MQFVASEYVRLGWAMQLHFGCKRDNNRAMFAKLGPDTGYDSISNYTPADQLADSSLHPGEERPAQDHPVQPEPGRQHHDRHRDGVLPGGSRRRQAPERLRLVVQRQRSGMRDQMTSLANNGVFGNFVGMLTDSRSSCPTRVTSISVA